MIRPSTAIRPAVLVVASLTLILLVLTGGAAAARAAGSCGIVTAAGKPWIVVAKGVPCPTAIRVVRALARRTAALRPGQKVVVRSPLRDFTCVISSHGKAAGSCAGAGALRSIIWLAAA